MSLYFSLGDRARLHLKKKKEKKKKFLPPYTITLGIRISFWILEEHIQSIVATKNVINIDI